MVSFKGAQFPKHVILHAVFFYVRYGVSYRDLEEILAERCVQVDHATLNRWVVKYATSIASAAQKRQSADETVVAIRRDLRESPRRMVLSIPGGRQGRSNA